MHQKIVLEINIETRKKKGAFFLERLKNFIWLIKLLKSCWGGNCLIKLGSGIFIFIKIEQILLYQLLEILNFLSLLCLLKILLYQYYLKWANRPYNCDPFHLVTLIPPTGVRWVGGIRMGQKQLFLMFLCVLNYTKLVIYYCIIFFSFKLSYISIVFSKSYYGVVLIKLGASYEQFGVSQGCKIFLSKFSVNYNFIEC
eukprot:TRINITY_DN60327_c0_g1_i1.p1 TRINITY_DN60327_c0_g1~~TRINITY_DN60327_c0_g1_i1.p1  ORF type:complete len:230 (+),score=-6.26 TRINITY_DN60327_c0_g1_i1:97-690(+)